MEKKYTAKDLAEKIFEGNKQRGKYLAFIVQELDQRGIQGVDEILRQAIFHYGKDKTVKWGKLNAREFMNRMMGDESGEGAYGFEEIGRSTPERAEFIFHRCPLEAGWKEIGLADKERHRLCSIARGMDFGLFANEANQDLQFEMPESIGRGNPVCHLIITKKK